MSVAVVEPGTLPNTPPTRRQAARTRFPPRLPVADWPATRQSREEILRQLTSAPFVLEKANSQQIRRNGVSLLLDWLVDQPGETWQERWQASGADAAGATWRQLSTKWLHDRGRHAEWRQGALTGAVVVAICADVVRPSLTWLVAGAIGNNGALVRHLARSRDPEGFARLRALCVEDPAVSAAAGSLTLYRSALPSPPRAARSPRSPSGTSSSSWTPRPMPPRVTSGTAVFYRMLRQMGIFGDQAPETLRQLRATGQRSPQELIDRYRLACGPMRDLLVDYCRRSLKSRTVDHRNPPVGELVEQVAERSLTGAVDLVTRIALLVKPGSEASVSGPFIEKVGMDVPWVLVPAHRHPGRTGRQHGRQPRHPQAAHPRLDAHRTLVPAPRARDPARPGGAADGAAAVERSSPVGRWDAHQRHDLLGRRDARPRLRLPADLPAVAHRRAERRPAAGRDRESGARKPAPGAARGSARAAAAEAAPADSGGSRPKRSARDILASQ
ncbi:MAG: hypothetical protein ACRDJ4_10640 [Actinomycetota bacterium]